MKRIFTAAITVAAIALAGAIPARATTFPSLTTIYFASGVVDSSVSLGSGASTIVSCSNLSGLTASVRYFFRDRSGAIVGSGTLLLANLAAQIISTEGGVAFFDEIPLQTGTVFGGTVQILSTQSAVYCSAMWVYSGTSVPPPVGIALHMVRLNPHPGTVE